MYEALENQSDLSAEHGLHNIEYPRFELQKIDKQIAQTRWYQLKYHETQRAYWMSKARFNVVPAGRRSGKTEILKRKTVLRALAPPELGGSQFPNPRYFLGAPTRDQAKAIFWEDIKKLVPPELRNGQPSESRLIMPLITNAEIHILGMDKPERAEGTPWDGGGLDEYGNMKKEVWTAHLRPALSDRKGWCDLIGVPEGRNHYYHEWKKALANKTGDRGAYHWLSAEILDAEEIEAAKNDLDPLTYQQEYEGCLLGSERILLSNGRYKRIKYIVVGDSLIYIDKNGNDRVCTVTACGSTGVKDILTVVIENGERFTASKYHKLKVDEQVTLLNETEKIEKSFVQSHLKTKSETKAALVGFNLGDGNVTKIKSYYQSAFYQLSKHDCMSIARDLATSYETPTPPVKWNKAGVYQVYAQSSTAKELVSLGCVTGRKTVQEFRVPSWIREGSKKVKRAFLSGLWSAEGSTPAVALKYKKLKILTLTMYKKENIDGIPFFEDLRNMLLDLQIVSSISSSDYGRHSLYISNETNNLIRFLTTVRSVYSYEKELKMWLWTEYLKAHRYNAANRRSLLKSVRSEGYTYREIGERYKKSMNNAYRLCNTPPTNCASHSFPPFPEWTERRWKESTNVLTLSIIQKTQEPKQLTYNIEVDSPDHSYILASNIRTYNSFINFTGRTYWPFLEELHCASIRPLYNRRAPLRFMLDFNIAPGVAAIGQEMKLPTKNGVVIGTGLIGEVYIKQNSNTIYVVRRFIKDWGDHEGPIYCYGDATGGAGGSAKVQGSDWELAVKELYNHFGRDRVFKKIPKRNPLERQRVNAVNSRLITTNKQIRMMVDPIHCPNIVVDLEGVRCIDGGSGEIDKKHDDMLTHISDAIGYYVHREFPIKRIGMRQRKRYWK